MQAAGRHMVTNVGAWERHDLETTSGHGVRFVLKGTSQENLHPPRFRRGQSWLFLDTSLHSWPQDINLHIWEINSGSTRASRKPPMGFAIKLATKSFYAIGLSFSSPFRGGKDKQ